MPRRQVVVTAVLCLAILAVLSAMARGDNWPQWRGPDGNGISREKGLPLTWSEKSGVKWRCPLPPWSNSTPAIWDDAIFVTTQADNEKLLLLKINKATGEIAWTREVGRAARPKVEGGAKKNEQRRHQWFHDLHNLASPSPVTDGKHIVVHFANGDLACYDFDGRQQWRHNLQKDYGDYTIWWGHANSPVLYGGLVISICIQDSCGDLPGKPSPSYVVAHDLSTGSERWQTTRMTPAKGEDGDSYTTPILRQNGQREELVIMGGQVLDAYAPATGQRLWFLPDLIGSRTVTGPVAGNGLIYVTQGMRQPLLAVRPSGDGRRPASDVRWQWSQGTPDTPTPVLWEKRLFLVSNDGIARCLDAETGKLHWKERLKGEYRASPLAAEGRIYFLNTRGVTTVVEASSSFKKMAENQLDDETMASPAVSDGRIYLRGRKAVYCIAM